MLKGLALRQPWATLVAIGAKKIETRSWGTKYRGSLVIYAAQRFPRADWELLFQEPFKGPLSAFTPPAGWGNPNPVPTGCIIAVVDLVECLRITARPVSLAFGGLSVPPAEPELSFGDYSDGRFAWMLENARLLARPVSFRGALSLFDVPEKVLVL